MYDVRGSLVREHATVVDPTYQPHGKGIMNTSVMHTYMNTNFGEPHTYM